MTFHGTDVDGDRPRNLAEKAFWETEYFADVSLPDRPDARQPFDRCLMRALREMAPVSARHSVIEIGCAPARWLVFYHEAFGAAVRGLEYSAAGAALSRANLARAGVPGDIVEGDFFETPPSAHDLVLSLGFIEHFDDLQACLDRHVRFCAPGGRIAIGVPNFRGINGALQRFSDPGHLAIHNTSAMDPARYEGMARRAGITLEETRYLGGFDPIILKIGRRAVVPLIMAGNLYRRWNRADRLNHRWVSSYLLLTFRRPRDPSPLARVRGQKTGARSHRETPARRA